MTGRSSEASAAERAQWLAELAAALDDAQALTRRLRESAGVEARELSLRIAAARFEVESLRLSRRPRSDEEEPKWTQSAPWHRAGD